MSLLPLLPSNISAQHVATSQHPQLAQAFLDSLFVDYSSDVDPGAAVLIAQNGRVLVRRGYGLADIEQRIRVTPATRFRLASLSKPLTASAVLLLVADGKLRLNETISDVFPGFPAYGQHVAISHLLSHTHGLLDGDLLSGRHVPTDTGVVTRLARVDSTSFAAGSRFRYSNVGFDLLAQVVAARSGMPFSAFLELRLFRPLGMASAYVCPEARAGSFDAVGYTRSQDTWTRADDRCGPAPFQGAGGVSATVDDLYRFDQALYSDALLPTHLLRRSFTPFVLSDGTAAPFGYGWQVSTEEGITHVSHFGSMTGFRSFLLRIPERRITIIVLTNRDSQSVAPPPGAIAREIARRLLHP